ncbi:hypothetical protein NIES4101_46200 [Calothrix sp. NIES-4101]|nr:hypothetical protein NIES4101_46200 [Calothrix sp. NIES-4101]
MPVQNEQVNEVLVMLFEYIYFLKQDNARLSAESASKDDVIAAKEGEALEFKTLYETYINEDTEQDGALGELVAKAKADLENLKAA